MNCFDAWQSFKGFFGTLLRMIYCQRVQVGLFFFAPFAKSLAYLAVKRGLTAKFAKDAQGTQWCDFMLFAV